MEVMDAIKARYSVRNYAKKARVRGLEPLSVFTGRIGLMLRSSP